MAYQTAWGNGLHGARNSAASRRVELGVVAWHLRRPGQGVRRGLLCVEAGIG